jgi:hypothetical protein
VLDDLREAARIAVRWPVWLGTAAALVFAQGAGCVAPLGPAIVLLGAAVRAAAGAPGGRLLGPGAAMAAGLALPGLGALAGGWLLPAEGAIATASSVLGALVVGLALAPLAALPAQLARGGSLGSALAAADGRTDVLFGLLVAAPAALAAALDTGPIALVLLASPPACLAIARGASAPDAPGVPAPLGRRVWLGPAVALASLGLAALVALALPAPAHRRLVPIPASGCGPALEETGRHGLSVRPEGDAFVVRVWDGGGAGVVEARSRLGARLPPRAVCPVERGFVLRFGDEEEAHALVDGAGVRQDDTLGARLRGRAGLGPVLALLAAGLALMLRRAGRRTLPVPLIAAVPALAALEILLRL